MSTDFAGATWLKSSHSGGRTDCVEVAWLRDGSIGVRDSKDPVGSALVFAPEAWAAFTSGVRKAGPTQPA
ncbi:DUF397 domain-containing protein [Nocardia brevicatena]|uniref:DUF397 domain-containing protein n=1 Tax=Nocardia brevicatena TaxID=37327 RepID=UPI000592F432|nr:DUF397 domain-containing protein [Nocardia brevicatena]